MIDPAAPEQRSHALGLFVIGGLTVLALLMGAALIALHPWVALVILGGGMTLARGWVKRPAGRTGK